MGSSGSTSPSSILVKIILASRPNTSSTPSPLSALTSIVTGIPTVLAHRLASSADTSRPSGATVARSCDPSPSAPDVDDEYDEPYGADDASGVEGGGGSSARSSLLPTRREEKLGEASARASLKKGCRLEKETCEVTS